MGKRKSSAKPAASKKRVEKLETCFTCPFCNHGQSVECKVQKVDMKDGTFKLFGVAWCFTCKEMYHTKATYLTEAIDIYSEWVDECELANKTDD